MCPKTREAGKNKRDKRKQYSPGLVHILQSCAQVKKNMRKKKVPRRRNKIGCIEDKGKAGAGQNRGRFFLMEIRRITSS